MTTPAKIRDPASSRGSTRGSWVAVSITRLTIAGPPLLADCGRHSRFRSDHGQTGNDPPICLPSCGCETPNPLGGPNRVLFPNVTGSWRFHLREIGVNGNNNQAPCVGSGGAAEECIYGDTLPVEKPFGDVDTIPVLLTQDAQLMQRGIHLRRAIRRGTKQLTVIRSNTPSDAQARESDLPKSESGN